MPQDFNHFPLLTASSPPRPLATSASAVCQAASHAHQANTLVSYLQERDPLCPAIELTSRDDNQLMSSEVHTTALYQWSATAYNNATMDLHPLTYGLVLASVRLRPETPMDTSAETGTASAALLTSSFATYAASVRAASSARQTAMSTTPNVLFGDG